MRPGRVTQHHVETRRPFGLRESDKGVSVVHRLVGSPALHENRPATVRGLGDGPRWREFRLTPAADATVVDLAE